MYSNLVSIFKRPALVMLVSAACYGPVCSTALAQSTQGGIASTAAAQAQLVAAAAQRDFAQYVQFNVQTRGGTLPTAFPLDVADVQDLKEAKLGHGFPIYTIDPKDMLMGRGDLRSMAKPTGEWRFVIKLHDNPIGLATLEQVNNRWEITSYGAVGLAREVDAAVAVHGNGARSNLRFIRVYQAMSDLLEVVSPADAHTRYAPLHSARQMLQVQQRTGKVAMAASSENLLEQADILEPLRASVKSNMETFR